MILVPMEEAGKRSFGQLVDAYSSTGSLESQGSGGFTYSEHRHTFRSGMTSLGKRINGIHFTVMFAYHGKAGYATLHDIMLLVERKSFHQSNLPPKFRLELLECLMVLTFLFPKLYPI